MKNQDERPSFAWDRVHRSAPINQVKDTKEFLLLIWSYLWSRGTEGVLIVGHRNEKVREGSGVCSL